MAEARACKECGKMFIPKGREKYCPDVHYRPCPVCGEPVIAKYLSDPPCKCTNCRRKRGMQPMSQVKSLFKMPELRSMPKMPELNDLTKSQPDITPANKVDITKENNKTVEPSLASSNDKVSAIDISKHLDPESFCDVYDDKVLRYIGPSIEGFHKFVNNHDYKIALTRKDNAYLITSCHDLSTNEEVNCYYLASSQLSVASRFVVVG